MATKKKMLQAAAGQAGGAALDITDVFSTYLYEGTSASKTITNGLDLGGEGGLVWIKKRNESTNSDHMLYDTERGPNERLFSNDTGRSYTRTDQLNSFDSDGFTLGADSPASPNTLGKEYVSWSFRKAPKFFTMVQWSGNSTMGRTISHDLGTDVGFILIKAVDKADAWYALHKDSNMLVLNQTTAEYNDATTADYFGDGTNIVRPTSTDFTIGSDAGINGTGYNYIAYLFAHNNGDGGFGPDGDQDIIKCGSYTGNGSTDGPEIDLGFEPQWVMLKSSSHAGNWFLFDNMRGITSGGPDEILYPDDPSAAAGAYDCIDLQPNGFKLTYAGSPINASGGTYIYIAIRRGPLAPPESATEVFDVQFNGGNDPSKAPVYQSGFVTDMSIVGLRTGGSVNYPYTGNRLMGIQTLETHNTDAEESGGASFQWDFMNGFIDGVPSVITDTQIAWMWKRSPGFFDVVAYSGDGVAGRTVSHNLGVAPEMIWAKQRSSSGNSWRVWYEGVPSGKMLRLNGSDGVFNETSRISDADATTFTLNDGTSGINGSGSTYIAYLFATVPGVSKVGSYTANGNAQNIDCGFTSGARFVLIKRTDTGGNWFVLDTARGIVSGNDPLLELNSTGAEDNQYDNLDPYSAGFTVAAYGGTSPYLNISGGTYIFYAIA